MASSIETFEQAMKLDTGALRSLLASSRHADGAAAGQRFEASTTGGSPAAPRMNIACEPWPM